MPQNRRQGFILDIKTGSSQTTGDLNDNRVSKPV
jgi:hypothetical protein